jgi:hypothetical protein
MRIKNKAALLFEATDRFQRLHERKNPIRISESLHQSYTLAQYRILSYIFQQIFQIDKHIDQLFSLQ